MESWEGTKIYGRREGGKGDECVDVPDKIACHVTIRTTRYFDSERISMSATRGKEKGTSLEMRKF